MNFTIKRKICQIINQDSIKDNVYYEGIVNIPIVLICGLQIIHSIVHTILFGWRKNLLMSIE